MPEPLQVLYVKKYLKYGEEIDDIRLADSIPIGNNTAIDVLVFD